MCVLFLYLFLFFFDLHKQMICDFFEGWLVLGLNKNKTKTKTNTNTKSVGIKHVLSLLCAQRNKLYSWSLGKVVNIYIYNILNTYLHI